ncbi:MAG: hypothetical protein D6696_19020 [Acidobacteria bacterium]|nr:MAG: hypothetical protein D6696_19020 [Acidobacteriota bacterium]
MSRRRPLKLAILLPAVRHPTIRGGGHLNTLRFAELMARHRPVELVSYAVREEGVAYLEDCEARLVEEGFTLLLTWGPDVAGHVARFHRRLPLVYYQQSMDWGFDLPADVPVISMSRYMLGHAQRTWPASPQLYLPQVLPASCRDRGLERDVDVLWASRKQPAYLRDVLLPRLEPHCRVERLERFVPREELHELFNRSRVYLYAFAPMRAPAVAGGWRLMEGVSTQNLEAMACGCTVVSDLRGGHCDFIEPEVHGHRLMSHSPEWDVEQVLRAVRRHPEPGQRAYAARLVEDYGEARFHQRAAAAADFLERFFAFARRHPPAPAAFGLPRPISPLEERWQRWRGTVHRLLRRRRR